MQPAIEDDITVIDCQLLTAPLSIQRLLLSDFTCTIIAINSYELPS